MTTPVILAKDLCIDYQIGKEWLNVIHGVTLQINPLQIHGLVGESGSGKSTLGLALMRYLAPNARIFSGEILLDGDDLVSKTPEEMRKIWGSKVSLVPQNPLDSLNPSINVGDQMAEVMQIQMGLSHKQAVAQAIEMLRKVKIADPERIVRQYPHQLSGGMQQRVMIAMALSTRPRFLVLDEPTTALDVTTQAVILDLFRELIVSEEAAALYVSHDLGTVAQLCDYVTVLYAGEVMESASVDALYDSPVHPYTIGLLESLPSAITESNHRLSTIEGVAPSLSERPATCVFVDRCPVAVAKCRQEKPPLETIPDGRMVRCWRWPEIVSGEITPRNKPQGKLPRYKPERNYVLNTHHLDKSFEENQFLGRLFGQDAEAVHAVEDVSIDIRSASTLGLVGESGSGKTTLARVIVALLTADDGRIELCEVPISNDLDHRSKDQLRNLQMVFQNPQDALNPYQTVGQSIGRTLRKLGQNKLSRQEVQTEVRRLLESVGLTAEYARRYPNQLSGGEKQRIAIARAFAADPALIVADEPTSSLDVSVQAVILNLLKDLRAEKGASYLIISHDLEVVSYMADWIVVMYLGEVMEQGSTEKVYHPPMHPYTEALLSAIPLADPRERHGEIRLEGDVPSPRHKPSGCPFHTRCPRKIGAICEEEAPPVRETSGGHSYRCHIPADELIALQMTALKSEVR
ncbi:MAG: dipeptide ABC transporter ATP-binding protein [Anaerolineae bacterium]